VCVVLYAPAATWKKSPQSRVLLDAVLASVLFKDARSDLARPASFAAPSRARRR